MRKQSLIFIIAGGLTALSLLRRKKVETKSYETTPDNKNDNAENPKEPSPPIELVGQTKEAQETEPTAPHSQKQAQTTQKKRWTNKRLQTIFTGAIALLTFVYALAAIVQWRTMEHQWETMEKTLRVSQRAYLVLKDVQTDLDAGRIKITVENIGHTPADEVNLRVEIQRNWGVEEPYILGPISAKIFPGAFYTQAIIDLEKFTQDEANLIRAGKEIIFMHCVVTYKDGFDNVDRTELFMMYVPSPNEHWESLSMKSRGEMKRSVDEALKNQNTSKQNEK
jgi:hypothetical protein